MIIWIVGLIKWMQVARARAKVARTMARAEGGSGTQAAKAMAARFQIHTYSVEVKPRGCLFSSRATVPELKA